MLMASAQELEGNRKIPKFSRICTIDNSFKGSNIEKMRPLNEMLKGKREFHSTDEEQRAFEAVKKAFVKRSAIVDIMERYQHCYRGCYRDCQCQKRSCKPTILCANEEIEG